MKGDDNVLRGISIVIATILPILHITGLDLQLLGARVVQLGAIVCLGVIIILGIGLALGWD